MAWIPQSRLRPLLMEVDRLALDIAGLRARITELANDESSNIPVGPAGPLQLLTAAQAADRMNVTRNTVYELARTKRMPCLYLGSRLRIPSDQLEEWITKGGTAPEGNSYFAEAEKRRRMRDSR